MKCSNFNSLKCFYDSAVGNEVSSRISDYLRPRLCNKRALLIGYGQPFLEKISNEKLLYAVPYGYEVNHWPKIRPFRTVVVDEARLPFASESFEIVVILNFLECSGRAKPFLDEISRILTGDGNLTVVSFNKFGFSKKAKEIRHSIKKLLMFITSKGFCLQRAYCISKKLHSFHQLKAFRYLFLKTFPFLYDIAILDAIKGSTLSEAIVDFQEKYEFT